MGFFAIRALPYKSASLKVAVKIIQHRKMAFQIFRWTKHTVKARKSRDHTSRRASGDIPNATIGWQSSNDTIIVSLESYKLQFLNHIDTELRNIEASNRYIGGKMSYCILKINKWEILNTSFTYVWGSKRTPSFPHQVLHIILKHPLKS